MNGSESLMYVVELVPTSDHDGVRFYLSVLYYITLLLLYFLLYIPEHFINIKYAERGQLEMQ